jgi:hypothetical protein
MGCIIQKSSLEIITGAEKASSEYGTVTYYGKYEMNMSKSNDVIVTIRNINSNEIFKPFARNQDGLNVIKAPEGEYILEQLIIREPQFTKCFCRIPASDKFVYGFSDRNCENLNDSRLIGSIKSGGLLLGEKMLIVNENHLDTFRIYNNQTKKADTIFLVGRIESLLKDLPNLEIHQNNSSNSEIRFFNKSLVEIKREKK